MRRVGPIVATELPGLVIGDVRARHVRLLPERVEHHDDDGTTTWAWDDLDDLRVDVPVTRWPHPALGDWIVPFVGAAFSGGLWDAPDVRDLQLRVRTVDGEALEHELSGHWAVGYPKRHAVLVRRLIELLRKSPDTRALLANPDAMLSRIGRILR